MLRSTRLRLTPVALACLLLAGTSARSQAPPDEATDMKAAIRELRDEVRELRDAITELRSESRQYRAETERLREQLAAAQAAETAGAGRAEAAPAGDARISALEEDQQLLRAKVDQQYQTKVESASKYRVRLSGIVLLNAFNNQGTVDSIDVPTLAQPRMALSSGGSAGATVRQSEIGLEAFGPELHGAKTRADVQLDLGGGVAQAPDGVTSALLRVRTATARMDWDHTSVIVGQDGSFLAPQSPTSFASLIVPALSYAGNLWSWVPQIRVEHRLQVAEGSMLTLQGGLLDPLTGEPPYGQYYRPADAGENSRKPGIGGRAAWSQSAFGRNFVVGASGYYSKQNWGFNRTVDGWVANTDWLFPFTAWLKLSGDFYRGNAIGGFGGGTGRSVLYSGSLFNPATQIRALDTMGGWTQLKIIPAPKVEFNGAFGQDNPFASDLRAFPNPVSYLSPTISRNRSGFVNFIYHPRSDLVFSAEYRRLHTFHIDNDSYTANHVNLAMGFLF